MRVEGQIVETDPAVQRLAELTGTLARRCAQLQEALDSRIVIEQAKGVVTERFDLAPDQAFDLLRCAARSSRMSLQELARQVVASRDTPSELTSQLDGLRPPAHTAL